MIFSYIETFSSCVSFCGVAKGHLDESGREGGEGGVRERKMKGEMKNVFFI